MGEASGGTGFLHETLAIGPLICNFLPCQRNSFDGYSAIDFRVAGSIHNSHRAASDLGVDLVTTQRLLAQGLHRYLNVNFVLGRSQPPTARRVVTGVTPESRPYSSGLFRRRTLPGCGGSLQRKGSNKDVACELWYQY